MLGLGRVAEEEGDLQAALERYSQVASLRQDETGAEALYRTGVLERQRGNTQRAVEILSSVPARFGSYTEWVAQSYLEQARAFRELDRPGDARRMYERVQAEFADTPFAQTATTELQRL